MAKQGKAGAARDAMKILHQGPAADPAAGKWLQRLADEEEGFDTVGGLVFGRLNRIPVVGDEIEVETGRLRVTQMSRRRIQYLLFVPGPAR